MSVKLSNVLRDGPRTAAVAPSIREYEDRYRKAKRGGLESRRSDHENFSNLYYDLVTDFYEFG